MKNVLFLTNCCHPVGSANGICALEIAKCLSKDHNVFIVCDRKRGENEYYKYENIDIYKTPQRIVDDLFDFYEKTNGKYKKVIINLIRIVVQKTQQLICSFKYPFYGWIHLHKQYRLANDICIKKNIDTVIVVVHPIESFIIANRLIKRHKNLNLVLYSLDRFSYGINIDSIMGRFKSKKMINWEKEMFKTCDMLLIMNAYKNYYSQMLFNEFRNKIYYTDIPLYRKLEMEIKQTTNDKIRFIYSGALYSDIRNPKYLCELFNKLPKNKFILDFYSRGDCQKLIESYSEINNCIHCNGYVTREENINNLFSSDIIVSIGSINCDMVPSKIFEYMSTGKKIMHIISYDNDAAVPYLRKYPNVLFIDSRGNIDENIDKLLKFIEKKESEIDDKLLDKLFKMNKPDYTAKLIENNLK